MPGIQPAAGGLQVLFFRSTRVTKCELTHKVLVDGGRQNQRKH
jgi:hypothetical protein